MEGAGTTTIEDFTKQHLIDTIPAHSVNNLILPQFHTPDYNEGIGCKLSAFYENWTLVTQDHRALDIVQNGYKPQFKEKPPLIVHPDPYEYNLSDIQKEALDVEVQHFFR